MDIQKRIYQLMEERNWSAYKLAQRAELAESTLTNLLKRKNAPSFNTVNMICNGLGITMAQFFSEGEEPVTLTDSQKRLLAQWSTLTKEQQDKLLEFIFTI